MRKQRSVVDRNLAILLISVKVRRRQSARCPPSSSVAKHVPSSLVENNAEHRTRTVMADMGSHGQYSAFNGYSSHKNPPPPLGLVRYPVAISAEHVSKTQTEMHIEEEQNLMGLSNFSATLDSGAQIFTVRGTRLPFSKKRELLDSNGTPILVLHARSRSFTCAWYAEIPNHHREHVLEVDFHGALGSPFSLNIRLKNRILASTAGSQLRPLDDTIPADTAMQVVCRSGGKDTFEVYLLGSRVADVKRTVQTAVGTMQPVKSHIWETKVAAGIDLSIVSLESVRSRHR